MESVGTNKDNKGKKKQRLIVLVVLLLIMVGYFTWLVKEKPLKKELEDKKGENQNKTDNKNKIEKSEEKEKGESYKDGVKRKIIKGYLETEEREKLSAFSDGMPFVHFYITKMNLYKEREFIVDEYIKDGKLELSADKLVYYNKVGRNIEDYKLRLSLDEYNRNMRVFNGSYGKDTFDLFIYSLRGVEKISVVSAFDFSTRIGSSLYFTFEKEKGLCLNFSKGVGAYDLLYSIPLSHLYVSLKKDKNKPFFVINFYHLGSYDKDKGLVDVLNKVDVYISIDDFVFKTHSMDKNLEFLDRAFIKLEQYFNYFFYRLDNLI